MKKTRSAKPDARVLICVPSGSDWKADFGMSLAALVAASSEVPQNYRSMSVAIQNTKGSILPQLRTKLVLKALEMDATHVLFVDSDMTFPSWLLQRMMEHDVDVVAMNCVTKSLTPGPTARFEGPTKAGIPMYHEDYDAESPDLVPVWRIGTGVMPNLGIFYLLLGR